MSFQPPKTIIQAIAYADQHRLPRISSKTVNQYISCLNLLLEWASKECLLGVNPARGLFVKEAIKKQDKRNPFSSEQLATIFKSKAMQEYQRTDDARFWVPLLALWTGARLGEICQLRLSDVQMIDGIAVLFIQEGDGKKLKTANANRIIPVHPVLVKTGFLEYVEEIRGLGSNCLFSDTRNSVRAYPSNDFSKWFTRYLRSIYVKQDKICFHSFRHNFRDALREAGIEREVVQALPSVQQRLLNVAIC